MNSILILADALMALHIVVMLHTAFIIAPARPLEWPAVATFLVQARFEDTLTGAQRMLLERQQLNEIKERYRLVGHYPPPILERRLPSALLVARDSDGVIAGCVGVEASVIDREKGYAIRRSSAESLIRKALFPRESSLPPPPPPSFGRPFHRRLTPEETEEEMKALRTQDQMLEDEHFAARAAELRCELDRARFPRAMALSPLLSSLAVCARHRRTGLGSVLLEAAETEVASWRYGGLLAMVEEDNKAACALFHSASWRVAFRDEGAQSTRPELPGPIFDRRELELIRVPMPQVCFTKPCGPWPESSGAGSDWAQWVGLVR
jgi:GNAT superfamily N-acetyltransferase